MMSKMLPVLALVLFGMIASSRPVSAETCFMDLTACYGRASAQSTKFRMWVAGLDCEVTFAACLRRALVNG